MSIEIELEPLPELDVIPSASSPFTCPGEAQPISRAVHLGRLASFYPACRECPHANETHTLSSRHVRQLQSAQRRARPATLFHEEGLAGSFLNEVGPAEVRRAATALAEILSSHVQPDAPLEVVLGCDGRPTAAEIGSAACDALRLAGCTILDAGFTTGGAVAQAIGRLNCSGGMYVGRGQGGPQHLNLSFFGPHAVALSAGGALDDLASRWQTGDRQSARQRNGSVRRQRIDAALITDLMPHFHALRPLRLVLDTTSLPLKQQLSRLAGRVSLEIIPVGAAADAGDRVRQTGAHFGIWIDGDGVCCQLIDERGDNVPPERLAIMLFRHFRRQAADCRMVVEHEAHEAVQAALGSEAELIAVPGTREQVARAMYDRAATVGGGTSGRYWFSTPTPVACALRTLSILLTIFSQGDRPVSEVCYE